MKTKQEHINAKRKATKEENEKKILDICGYEIWRDPLNYTVVKNGKNTYFSTINLALTEVRNELIRSGLKNLGSLESVIEVINEADGRFFDTLSNRLASQGGTLTPRNVK